MFDADVSVEELAYRLSSPKWVASQSWRYLRESTARFIPSEFNRLFRKVRPITMVSYARLRGLYDATRHLLKEGVSGEVVECGVARGGSAAMIALTLQQLGAARKLWLFDTFSGLPQPTEADPDFKIANRYTGTCRAGLAEVKLSLEQLGISVGIEFVPGLFRDTVPQSEVKTIALLHLDGDWYESVKTCIDYLYDRVSPGGIIQFDDYGHWAGARKAVDEFIATRGIVAPLIKLDFAGRQLVKPY